MKLQWRTRAALVRREDEAVPRQVAAQVIGEQLGEYARNPDDALASRLRGAEDEFAANPIGGSGNGDRASELPRA